MKRHLLKWSIGCAILGVLIATIGFWQIQAREAVQQWDPERARRHNEPIPVRTVTITEGDISEVVGGTAVTTPSQTAVVSVFTSNANIVERRVTSVKCWQGMEVKQGQVLIEFDPTLFKQVVAQRTAAMAKAEEELQALRQLYADKAVSKPELRQAEVAYESARLELATAQRDLELCVATSPIDGVVNEVKTVTGMTISGNTELVVIHQLDPIYVEMDFPVERLDALAIGQTTEVVLDSFPQETYGGQVIRIAPVVVPKTRVLPVIVELANRDQRIKAGITGFVRVWSEQAHGTTVPSLAVIRGENRSMVFCIEEDRARIREVQVGPMTEEGEVRILSGLQSGDQVVIYGQDVLQDNDPVNVNWRQWARRE